MYRVWVTSDLHFNHNKEFLFEPRGFKSIEEHDKAIITNWNSVVGIDDIVYVLGDIGMGTDIDYLVNCISQLSGNILWVLGNHDTPRKIEFLCQKCTNLRLVGYASFIKSGKWRFYLSHYPTAVGNYEKEISHKKFYSLCGHSHCKDRWNDFFTMKAYHCELDCHNNYPISLEQIIEDIKGKTNN